jgi:ATP-dependent Lon protease
VRDAVVFPGNIHTLHVLRDGSRRAIRAAAGGAKQLFVVSQRDMSVEEPSAAELYRVGTLCEVVQTVPLPDGSLRVALRSLRRAEAQRYDRRGGMFSCVCAAIVESAEESEQSEAMMRLAVEDFGEILEKSRSVPAEAIETVAHQASPGALADAIAHHLPLRTAQKQALLEERDPVRRLQEVLAFLRREKRLLRVQGEISEKVDREFATSQREFFLREQLRTIQSELDALGEGASELAALRERIAEASLPAHALARAQQELDRLDRLSPHSPEGMVVRNYLDWLLELPWSRQSPDRLDVSHARHILDEEHFGLNPVKERILDFLAVRQLSRSLRGPILCFVGPPGVGKTSVGRSIAESLGREFVRISLGGLRDEAEIRGHRRTYVAAMPGRILQSLRTCGTRNPVIVLDEIDKMSRDFRGDPSSALLEALDPAQNERFSDHFLEVPFDLSAVLFIATANLAEDIPHALRDRMEIVRFGSYTPDERLKIAEDFIVPRQRAAHGLDEATLSISRPALRAIVEDYTREAGVRELERRVAAVCRKAARQIAEGRAGRVRVTRNSLEHMLGQPRFLSFDRLVKQEVGTANALVVTEYGGEVLPVEVLVLNGSTDGLHLRLTGNLGAVMRESADAALSFVRSSPRFAQDVARKDIHIHVPENAIPKDGPSAGLTIAAALASALSGIPARADVALTGEITLRGRVLAIGGVREKLVAAQRAGIRTVVLPSANSGDLADVPKKVRAKLDVRLVETADEALQIALSAPPLPAASTA